MRNLAVLLVLLLLSGCLTVTRYDPNVVVQIEKTIEFEELDYELTRNAMSRVGDQRTHGDLLGLKIRHESELYRLWAWLHAERGKKTP